MTTEHDDALELAAAAIDFSLSDAERVRLDRHLATCVPCRRQVTALQADQRSMAALPPAVIPSGSAQRIRGRLGRDRASTMSTTRLVLLAAMLVLAALSAAAVGSQLLLDRDDPFAIVTPPATVVASTPGPSPSTPASASVTPSAGPSEAPSPQPAEPPDAGTFAAGNVVDVVVTDLRVRTAPTVDNAVSAKLEPLLGVGTRLRVISGPVRADDYDWYEVEAIGLPHRGWVAAADHDGEPWIILPGAPAAADFEPAEAALVSAIREDAAIGCSPRRTGLPERAIAGIECRIASGVVDRVGVYGFRDGLDAAAAYRDRLLEYGVVSGEGDCATDRRGDHRWGTSDLERAGCFVDATGSANVRVTCDETYIGVVGRDDDVAALYRWAWDPVDPDSAGGEAPGLCGADRT